MALAAAKQEATDTRLSAMGPVRDSGCLATARAEALTRVRDMGLPARRDEYWKYTSPADLTGDVVKTVPVASAPLMSEGALRVVFVDGVFDAARSDDLDAAGLSIECLSEVEATDIHWAKDLYGTLESRGNTPVARPLGALNTAYATDGIVVHVQSGSDVILNLIYETNSESSEVFLHHLIKIETGAAVTLLEDGTAGARGNTALEVVVGDEASFNHLRTQGVAPDRRVVTHLYADLGTKSAFKSFTAATNGAVTRNEAVITLNGDEAAAHIAGAFLGNGATLHDDTVFITHDAVDCESRQVFKKVLRNGATGVFQGKILVQPDAQKTDGYQISQSLLLDEDSQFLAKPELEIYADDVACSHGSTSGAIDGDALFYLRARGVEKAEAQNLLTLSFLAEAVEEIEDESLAELVLGRLEDWLRA